MIKGGLEGVITTDKNIYDRVLSDEIMSKRLISLINSPDMLGTELEKHLATYCKRVC
jgi:hypothetical protein